MTTRTPAQKAADYRRSFPAGVNARRGVLIEKMFAGGTEEENARQFAEHPGWKEECERREHANLTDYERAELSLCEQVLSDWEAPIWAARHTFVDEFEARIREKLESTS